MHGNEAFLYFECHDIGNFATGGFDDPTVTTIMNDTFLAGTLHNVRGNWVFWNMNAGPSSPLSYDHYYYPSGKPAPAGSHARSSASRG